MPADHQHSPTTHASIFLRLNTRDPKPREFAWSEFRERYAPIIGGFARKMGARASDVEDITQDVLTGFFAKSPTFVYDPSKGRFRGYLKTCTYHAVCNGLSHNARFKALPLSSLKESAPEVEAAWNDAWESAILKRSLESVREHFADGNTFRAFQQCVLEDKDAVQVASDLGVSVRTVNRAKSRVLAMLRERLRHLRDEAG
ncbi:MAG: RNA polymerase sigma factor [Tepidisphaeraceae bacterium]